MKKKIHWHLLTGFLWKKSNLTIVAKVHVIFKNSLWQVMRNNLHLEMCKTAILTSKATQRPAMLQSLCMDWTNILPLNKLLATDNSGQTWAWSLYKQVARISQQIRTNPNNLQIIIQLKNMSFHFFLSSSTMLSPKWS